jgi:hypothetical protein
MQTIVEVQQGRAGRLVMIFEDEEMEVFVWMGRMMGEC